MTEHYKEICRIIFIQFQIYYIIINYKCLYTDSITYINIFRIYVYLYTI